MSRDDFPSARGTRTWRWIRSEMFRLYGLSWLTTGAYSVHQ